MFNALKIDRLVVTLERKYSNTLTKKLKKINISRYSTKVAVVDENVDKDLARTIEQITDIRTKEHKKKPQKPPFAKNLFLGIFDRDILAYPEVLDKNQVDNLEKDLTPIRDFFENIDDKHQMYITKEYLSNLSKLKLIGLQLPTFEGGRQLTLTETCRFLEEMSRNSSRIGVIDSEQLGVQILAKYGTEKHKKYLNRLMNGDALISFCASEVNTSGGSELFETKAVLSADGTTWTINGTKKLVVNGNTANLFIVFAETEQVNKNGVNEKSVDAFIVERDYNGITSTPCTVTGLDQTDISNIKFENTRIPAENLIGTINDGNKVISTILNEYRISKGPVLSSLLQNGINTFIGHCIKIDNGSKTILETDAVKSKLGELTMALYAIESTTYLTTGLVDQYENQDCELEAAIVKMISASYCHDSIASIMHFMGAATYLKENWCNRLYRDSLGHILLNEPVDSLKITTALLGLRHAGIKLQDTVRQLRNPFFNAGTIFKKIWTQRRHIADNPKLYMRLHENLHPSMFKAAQYLEYCVLRLEFATETLLTRYGPEVVNKHIELSQLAECVADIYVLTAVLGRASRSYCIGLRHADIEMEIAMGFAVRAMERVKINVNKIWHGPYITVNDKYLKIGGYAVEQKEYFPVHAMSRVF